TMWRLLGPLDIKILQRSLDVMVSRHGSLGTRFIGRKGEPVQVIEPVPAVAVSMTGLGTMLNHGGQQRARQIASPAARQPFNLAAGPLLRAELLHVAADDHFLLLNIHHIVSDGWSMAIVGRELSVLYNALVSGQEPELPELPVQYADYAIWQRE